MNTTPITCSGYELDQVLSGIRERGGFPWNLEAKVGGNAGYRIHYFTKTETSQLVTLGPIDEADKSPEGPGRDANKPLMRKRKANDMPSPIGNDGPNNFGFVGEKPGAGSSRTPVRQLTASSGANPAAPEPFPVHVDDEPCKTPIRDVGPKCSEAQASIMSRKTDTPAAGIQFPEVSIEQRMASLAEKHAAMKIKRRQPVEARMPYAD